MTKAEKFISDCTRNCSNDFGGGTHDNEYISTYYSWLTPDQARKAVETAREEVITKTCEWLRSRLDINVDIKTDSDGHPLADSYMNYAQKRLEAADNFVDAFKEAMLKED